MAISSDYPRPVQVNGFECRNCTDVDYAKKHIDPKDPKSGPYGVNDTKDKTDSAFSFGGALAAARTGASSAAPGVVKTSGGILDLRA